ncbi:hypothetical protein CRYUN_Cryun21dG0109300 [Craigia yunnanensis]
MKRKSVAANHNLLDDPKAIIPISVFWLVPQFCLHGVAEVFMNWLPDRNLNRGRLEYYYWLVSGIQVVNLIYYIICYLLYTNKPLEEVKEEDGGEFNENKVSENGV